MRTLRTKCECARRAGLLALAVAVASLAPVRALAAYERIPSEVIRALGTTRGRAVATGLVFIDGKYLRAPYHVTRSGTQILINERPVTGPLVSWDAFVKTQRHSVSEVEAPAEAKAEKPQPKPAAKPKAEKKPSADLDDLDDLFDDVVIEKKPAETEKKAAPAPAAAAPSETKMRKVYTLDGAFVENARSRKLLKSIDAYRAKLETTLRRGGYLFFGTGERRYSLGRTSDATMTRELLKKLPELMREGADDAARFSDVLRSAGLMSYITMSIAQDLYRNRTDFVALMQRRRELDEEDKLKKMMNSHGR